MQPPTVSVVMPAWNAERFLVASIDSIRAQTMQDWELLVIDDGSIDSTAEIIREAAAADSRVRTLCFKRQLGAAEARNAALRLARGRYIAILDADDIALPRRLSVQRDYLDSHPQVFLVGGSYENINESGALINTVIVELDHGGFIERLEQGLVTRHSTMMYRNVPGLEYREKFRFSHDTDFLLRLATEGRELRSLCDVAVRYRVHRSSMGGRHRSLQLEFARAARRFYVQRRLRGTDEYATFDPDMLSRLTIWDEGEYVMGIRLAYLRFEETRDVGALRRAVLALALKRGMHGWREFLHYLKISCPRKIRIPLRRLLYGAV